MKKNIITLMLLCFMSITAVNSAYAADRRHHHHPHPHHHGHGHDRH